MRAWPTIIAWAISVVLIAIPVGHVLAPNAIGAVHTQIDQHADKAMPVTATVCCPTSSLPVAATIEHHVSIVLLSWIISTKIENAGRSPALEPRPPLL